MSLEFHLPWLDINNLFSIVIYLLRKTYEISDLDRLARLD